MAGQLVDDSQAGDDLGEQTSPADTEVDDDQVSSTGSEADTVELEGITGKPGDWAAMYEKVLMRHTSRPLQLPDRKLKVFTLCSGTESPIKALAQLLPRNRFEHTLGCDVNSDCFKFSMLNAPPLHFYENMSDLLIPAPYCKICCKPCSAHLQEVDVMTAVSIASPTPPSTQSAG